MQLLNTIVYVLHVSAGKLYLHHTANVEEKRLRKKTTVDIETFLSVTGRGHERRTARAEGLKINCMLNGFVWRVLRCTDTV